MLGIPAKLAGCREVVLCTPPDTSGKINAAILFAAQLVGVTKIFKVGGAQAIAAMAYGTQSIQKFIKFWSRKSICNKSKTTGHGRWIGH